MSQGKNAIAGKANLDADSSPRTVHTAEAVPSYDEIERRAANFRWKRSGIKPMGVELEAIGPACGAVKRDSDDGLAVVDLVRTDHLDRL